MRGVPWSDDGPEAAVTPQVLKNAARVKDRTIQSNRKRLKASEQEPSVEGTQSRSFGILKKSKAMRDLLVTRRNDTRRHISMSTERLRSALNRDVRPVQERTIEIGRQHRVVHR
jgi:hypothetical protein